MAAAGVCLDPEEEGRWLIVMASYGGVCQGGMPVARGGSRILR